MIDPVAPRDFLVTFVSAAAVIIFGAGYAALFAQARLSHRVRPMIWAYACYAGLAVAVLLLANAAHLDGFWSVLTVLMLAGYFVAPHIIWHLCITTHIAEQRDSPRDSGGDTRRSAHRHLFK